MNKYITLVLAVLFAACSQPSQGPSAVDAAVAVTSAAASVAAPSSVIAASADPDNAGATSVPTKPFVPKLDLRSAAQVAMAACVRSDGSWACPAIS